MTNYDIDYFIAKFEAIPEEEWCNGSIRRAGQCCALGHCEGGMMDADTERGQLYLLTNFKTPDINDGLDLRYPQPTPKQRILAALRDISRRDKMKSLDEYNAEKWEAIAAKNKEIFYLDIACPNCGHELHNPEPGVTLCSDPPQIYVACEACNFKGTALR